MLSFESFLLQVSLLSFCTLQVQLSSIRLRPLSNPFVTLYHVLQAYLEGDRHCRSFLPYSFFRSCLFLAPEVRVIMVFFTYVDKVSLTILCVILEIKLFSTTFFAAGPWSARLVWRFSCRFSRGLVVVFVLVGSNIFGQPATYLPPEIKTVTSVFLKCNEQILGSTRLLNLLSAR